MSALVYFALLPISALLSVSVGFERLPIAITSK